MKFLITGANGFVGQHLYKALFRQAWEVRLAVRTPGQFRDATDANVVIGNIDINTNWTEALNDVDVVIHLAARAHVMNERSPNPLTEFLAINLYGTTNLAKQAAAAGVKRFVYVSSVKVNGEQTSKGRAFVESDNPEPQDFYAVSKWQAEQALQAISQETGMEIVIVRPPLVYGPEVKANFKKLLALVYQDIPLPLARIENSRSLVYVGNLVDALIVCATHPAAAGQTYLVSDSENVSTPQLVQKLAHALYKPNRIFPIPVVFMRGVAKLFGKSAAIDRLIQSLVIDSSKIRKDLGWQPPYTMAQGLQATADWYLQSVKSRKA